jgi:hypothetical protein
VRIAPVSPTNNGLSVLSFGEAIVSDTFVFIWFTNKQSMMLPSEGPATFVNGLVYPSSLLLGSIEDLEVARPAQGKVYWGGLLQGLCLSHMGGE